MNRFRNYIYSRVDLSNKYVWYVAGFADALIVLVIIAAIIKVRV